MIEKDDWRLLRGRIEYLENEELVYHSYTPYDLKRDHDHCEFCMEKFQLDNNNMRYGYSIKDNYTWIYEQCYHDFKEMFKWKVINKD